MLSGLAIDFFDPFPGRAARALEISLVCALVVVVSMAYGIPDPATSTYLVFFAAKEDSGSSIIANMVLILVVTIVVGIAFGLAWLSLNSPELRIILLAAWTFSMFFLATASKLAPLAGTIGLIVAYAIDLFASAPLGEIATRGLLYAWLFVTMPMLVFFIYNIFFGRAPTPIIVEALDSRLTSTASLLREPKDAEARNAVAESCGHGNGELLKLVQMTGLFHFHSRYSAEQLQALITMTYNLATVTLIALDGGLLPPLSLADRISALAQTLKGIPGQPKATGQSEAPEDEDAAHAWQSVAGLIAEIERIVHGGHSTKFTVPVQSAKTHSGGFFTTDAFVNADHTLYALKGTLAVTICYLTFSLLNWPAIHTCMLTCFIVGLTTVGESIQKLSLRIAGCVVGGLVGLLVIVYVMPRLETIWGLALLIGAVTFPVAWVAVGRPTVAYFGFQAAFALYLSILQGDEPKFDLTILRDRSIGILFGNVITYLVFTSIFPVSVLAKLRHELESIIDRSRDLLRLISTASEPMTVGYLAAALQGSIDAVESKALALGYETLNAQSGERQRDLIDRCLVSLRSTIDMICRISVFSSVEQPTRVLVVNAKQRAVDAELAHLAEHLGGSEVSVQTDDEPIDAASMPPLWRESFAELDRRITSLGEAVSDYRDVLRIEVARHE